MGREIISSDLEMSRGMYKQDPWLNSPNPLEEAFPPEHKIAVPIVCDMEWSKLLISGMNPKEDCVEFIKNKYGMRSKAIVRHTNLLDAEIRDQDVIVVYREKSEEASWVEIHLKWGKLLKTN
jgi:hypothetical protein